MTVRAAIMTVLAIASLAHAQSAAPSPFAGLGIDQKLGQQVPPDLILYDEAGHAVRLDYYFNTRKPILLTLVYFNCPMLCTVVLNNTAHTLRAVPLNIGDDFELLTVSFDPRETPALAAAKKKNYLTLYDRPGANAGWHFLTADQRAINTLTDAVGFHYRYDSLTNQYIHPGAILLLTPQGKISRYLLGASYEPRDLRLSLIEAADGRVGSLSDMLLLFCYHYDPATGKYGFAIINIVRAAGILTVLMIGVLLFHLSHRHRKLQAADVI